MSSLFSGVQPLPKQVEFQNARDTHLYRAYVGGFGSGKTRVGCWESIYLSLIYPGNLGIICRNTYPELRDTTYRTFFEECPEEIIQGFNKNEMLLTFKPLKGGHQPSQILFRSLDRYEKFKSLEIGFFFIDEASDVKEEVFLLLCGRLRRKVPRCSGFITSNPSTTRHWLYQRFLEKKSSDYMMVRAPTSENIHLHPDYERILRENYPPDWVDRFLEGEFGFIAEGERVYPEFKEQLHCHPVKFDPLLPVMRSWDFGLIHPAVILCQVSEVLGGPRLSILGEIQGENELIDVFSDRIKEECLKRFGSKVNYLDFCDPAGNQKSDKSPKTSIGILRSKGIYPISSFQHILDGVQIIKMLLYRKYSDGNPALIINPDCENLIQGFMGGYGYPKTYDGSGGEPKPHKDGYFDHLQDCLRYLIWNTKFKTWLKPPAKKVVNQHGSFNSWRKIGKRSRGQAVRTISV